MTSLTLAGANECQGDNAKQSSWRVARSSRAWATSRLALLVVAPIRGGHA